MTTPKSRAILPALLLPMFLAAAGCAGQMICGAARALLPSNRHLRPRTFTDYISEPLARGVTLPVASDYLLSH